MDIPENNDGPKGNGPHWAKRRWKTVLAVSLFVCWCVVGDTVKRNMLADYAQDYKDARIRFSEMGMASEEYLDANEEFVLAFKSAKKGTFLTAGYDAEALYHARKRLIEMH